MKELSKKLMIDDSQAEDEFDEMCSNLLHIEPPSSLIENIMNSVEKLPPAKAPDAPEKMEEGLIVQHGGMLPS